jgi:hypothetical protein
MSANPTQIIVTTEVWAGQPVTTLHAHHRDFPEIQAEGETALAAAAELEHQLRQALEAVSDPWHRGNVVRAIEDLQAFVMRPLDD